MNSTELRATIGLAAVFAARLLGLFMIYPVFAHYAQHLRGASAAMIGLALGGYGLAQGLLQIPLGLLSDRIGRKTVISLGLVLFAVGSVVAALSHSIEGVILGRVLQGCGAVGSAILALVADLTRDEVRTRAMAVVGITIGLSFALALLVGSPLAARYGLSGVFWITAGLALAGIAVTLGVVPSPDRSARARSAAPAMASFVRVLGDRELLRLDFAIFSLHAVLTASFLVIPQIVSGALHLGVGRQWSAYLPILAASLALMVPAVVIAETRGRMKEVFVATIAALAASLAALAFGGAEAWVAWGALVLFFGAFNVMEAILPSLVTKTAPAEARGAATGVYSSAQFLGIFAGGAGGGWALMTGGARQVFACAIALIAVWLALALTMRRPAARRRDPSASRRGRAQA